MNTINGANASAISSGLYTISSGSQRLAQDAQQIANPDADSTRSLVDLPQASIQAQAGAEVIRTANQTLGSLLNAFA